MSESLRGEYAGIEKAGDGKSLVGYCDYLPGHMGHREWKTTFFMSILREPLDLNRLCG